MEGASNDFYNGNDFITERNVILVTINYRLGVFGFLSLNTPEYSGNMGLKDQQMALKWVSENIERFGGDSKRITIFGHSAGKFPKFNSSKTKAACESSADEETITN